jgi:hypothetical protein
VPSGPDLDFARREIRERDLAARHGGVPLPGALARKLPRASREGS